jgi:hypothetical protein
MHVENLLKLADLLEADALNEKGVKFDLGYWAAPANIANTDLFPTNDTAIPVDCNTRACAMGLAVISGAFEDQGLHASYHLAHNGGYRMIPALPNPWRGTPYEDFEAAEKLFDIEHTDATYLFDQAYYGDLTRGAEAELTVARRIRDLTNSIIDKDFHPDYQGDDRDDG